jgi:hypothetical protein
VTAATQSCSRACPTRTDRHPANAKRSILRRVPRGLAGLILTGALAALPLSLGVVSSATAYTHSWSCSREAFNHCTDASGKTYNPWHVIETSTPTFANWCVKGTSEGGTVYEFACVSNAFGVMGIRCTAPEVQAYSYGGGYSGKVEQTDHASTEGGC